MEEKNVWFSEVSPRPYDTGMAKMITYDQNELICIYGTIGSPVLADINNIVNEARKNAF